MDAARWERIQELFHATAERPAGEQRAFLETCCTDDPGLVAEVLALLAEDGHASLLLDRDLAHAAQQVFADVTTTAAPGEIGAYRIREVLGEGGMGVVYLAERTDLGSLAAVKLLRDAWLSPARRERFAAEQRTLAQLNHPSIARLFDAGTLPDGTPWLVMEYVAGVPITEHCRAHGMNLRERLYLFREVCEAVQHAHRHLVVHRDLKPSNILVQGEEREKRSEKREKGGGSGNRGEGRKGTAGNGEQTHSAVRTPHSAFGRIKLLDFGIAKHLEDFGMPADQTRTGVRLMTPAYAAPEQLRGGSIGVHTDVYALGVLLWELLVGHTPFDLSGLAPTEAERVLLDSEPERPTVVARRLAKRNGAGAHLREVGRAGQADLDVLCLGAMQKDARRRYPTVEALIRDLDHYLAGEPLEARPDSARYRLGKFLRRRWQPVSAAAAFLLLLVGTVGFYTLRLAAARNAAVAEAGRTERIQRFTLNLLSGGDDAVSPADSLRVVALLDRGVQEAALLVAEPAVQAELLHTLGEMYRKLGRLERADSLLGEVIARRRSHFGAEHPEVAASLVSLGLLRSDQARFAEGERSIQEALDMQRRLLPPLHPRITEATEALGHVLVGNGEYERAIPILAEVVSLRSRAGAARVELAGSLYQLAGAHFYLGNLEVSDSLNRRALILYRDALGEHHPHFADALVNLGAIQQERGNYTEAERYHRQALDIKRAWHGPDHPAVGASLTMVARALLFQERLDEAAGLLRQALDIRERAFGPLHPQVASTVNELGAVALRQKQYDEAEAAYRRILAIYRATYDGEHYLIGVAASNLGSVYSAREQYSRAESLFREAIASFTRTLAADNVNLGIARIKLGRALLRQGRFAEAELETLAGHDILAAQANPAVSFLTAAREDLATIYERLGRPDQATRFRAAPSDTARDAGTRRP
jgi:eukaryotic-like serine/threonine-protein kinase